MDLQLRGKRAFVSGASSGIGKATALELAGEGCDVVVHGRDKARTEETANEITKLGVKAWAATGDLMKEADADKVCKTALDAVGTVDILVNNCGLLIRKDAPDWLDLPDHEWTDSFQVNFMTTLRVSQRMAPGMKAQKWGRIINISTAASAHVFALGAMTDYGSPKAALNKFTVD